MLRRCTKTVQRSSGVVNRIRLSKDSIQGITAGFSSKSMPLNGSSDPISTRKPRGAQARANRDLRKRQPLKLSEEQRNILRMVREGKSVFIMGSAGTGKSFLLGETIRTCRKRFGREKVAVTAATGIAAVNIGGCTLHSWAGVGLGKEGISDLIEKIQTSGHSRWSEVNILIIDEISMIDGTFFDKLECIAREFRSSDAPFGGIQLVLCGDFCQLPPVPDHVNGMPKDVRFAFDALTWEKCVGRPVVLTKVFRQTDQVFITMLNEMRFGRPTAKTIDAFRKLSRHVEYKDGKEPTELSRLAELSGPCHTFKAKDTPLKDAYGEPVSEKKMEVILTRQVAPKLLTLKVGAQVMLIKNLHQNELVNGSVGRVVAFTTVRDGVDNGAQIVNDNESKRDELERKLFECNDVWPIVRFDQLDVICTRESFEATDAIGTVEAVRDQVPLILAWAVTIHKSQGQGLERVRVNMGRIFEKGQAYVALSRAKSMQSLQVLGFDPAKVRAHPRVIKWMKEVLMQS